MVVGYTSTFVIGGYWNKVWFFRSGEVYAIQSFVK